MTLEEADKKLKEIHKKDLAQKVMVLRFYYFSQIAAILLIIAILLFKD